MSVRGAPAAFPRGPDSALLYRVTGRAGTEAGVAFKPLQCHFSTPPTDRDFTLIASCLSGHGVVVVCTHGGSLFFTGR